LKKARMVEKGGRTKINGRFEVSEISGAHPFLAGSPIKSFSVIFSSSLFLSYHRFFARSFVSLLRLFSRIASSFANHRSLYFIHLFFFLLRYR
jgi:hypothetical protein